MKALYYPDWNELELRDVDPPRPSEGEVLIRVAACGVCGSEIETFSIRSRRRTPPLIMGHEFCGFVEALGPNVEATATVFEGARVVSNAVLNCGRCDACLAGRTNLCPDRTVFGMHRPGAFAEFVTAPADCLFKWPDAVSAEEACLTEPLANGIHVVGLIERLKPRLVLIIGSGSIGLMCLQAVRSRFEDARCVVTDVDTVRLEVAKRLGADTTVGSGTADLSDTLRSLGGPDGGQSGADVVIDAAGTAATKQLSIDLSRPGGAVVWIGLGEDQISLRSYDLTLAEKSVLGSYGATAANIREALRLMEARHVDVSSWITTYEPPDWVDGFKRQLDPSTRDVKAVLTPVRTADPNRSELNVFLKIKE